MSRLSIGMVCFPSFGGSGVVASELAIELARRGHDVHVIASAPPSRTLPFSAGLRFHRVRVSDYPLFDYAPYTLALASTMADLGRLHALDVFHVHYAVPHAASALLARAALGRKAPALVTSLHGTDVTRLGPDPSYATVTRFSVEQSDAVVVPSAFLEREARRLLALAPTTPVEVIPNFVDTEHFAPPQARERRRLHELFPSLDDGPMLFHVSNFRPVKRLVDAMEVLARLRRHVPARMVLVGDGPERARVEARARELGVAEHVRFLGKRLDFVEHLQHADAFLLPSETESFGVAGLEALSAGVPVFGYRVGGLPEVVTEEVGRLVEPFDVEALTAAVRAVLGDPPLHARLARAARAWAVSRFRLAPAVDRYEACYERVLAGARRKEG